MPRYRADIDGLRAVAVLAVVAFHAGFRAVPGGFVGVDVFFVISGYLICGLIEKDLAAGAFSLGAFYKRRILRIAPAFVAVLLAATVLAYLYMLPVELDDFAGSLIAATLSASNIFFAGQSGYFDTPALSKPLLHTWSLGVEEQFYLVFPLLLLGLRRLAERRRILVLGTLAAASLGAAAACSAAYPVAVFYQMPFRFWELALGALAALGAFPAPAGPAGRNLAAGAGLALIVGAVFLASDATPFVLATGAAGLGALLVILAGERGSSLAGRGLSLPPVVFVGLISYSLYLWHWPIIVFQTDHAIAMADSTSPRAKLVIIAFAIVVAAVSWRLVEQPFRRRGRALPRGRVFGAAAAAAAALVGIGVATLAMDGAAFRFPPAAVRVARFLAYDHVPAFREGQCFVHRAGEFDAGTCLRRDKDKPNILLIGDSHAAHLWWGLSHTLPEDNVLQATASGCKPEVVGRLLESRVCRALMNTVFDEVIPQGSLRKVVIAAQWTMDDVPKVAATLDRLAAEGIPVLLIGPIPQYDYALPRLLAEGIRAGDPGRADAHRDRDLEATDAALRAVAAQRHVPYVSLMDLLCRDGRCVTSVDDVPLQFDSGHLTREGSLLVARRLEALGVLP